MTLAKFDPLFKEFARMNRMLGGEMWEPEGTVAAADWKPAVDILEGENEIVIKVELPGVERKDIAITVDNNLLTLKGERRLEKDVKKENYHRMEHTYGTFTRSFVLPGYVDFNAVAAEHKDGLLKIVVPKKATAKGRSIEVSAA